MQLKTRDAAKIFKKLEVEPAKSTHHIRGFLVVDGIRILPLHYSHGRKDLPGPVPKRFANSLRLNLQEFGELKRCTMSRDAYLDVLVDRGVIGKTSPEAAEVKQSARRVAHK